jgi:hypothetical protein
LIAAKASRGERCLNSDNRPSLFGQGTGVRYAVLEGYRIGEAPMVTRILKDFVLFSCLAAFITGIVLAAATLLI